MAKWNNHSFYVNNHNSTILWYRTHSPGITQIQNSATTVARDYPRSYGLAVACACVCVCCLSSSDNPLYWFCVWIQRLYQIFLYAQQNLSWNSQELERRRQDFKVFGRKRCLSRFSTEVEPPKRRIKDTMKLVIPLQRSFPGRGNSNICVVSAWFKCFCCWLFHF